MVDTVGSKTCFSPPPTPLKNDIKISFVLICYKMCLYFQNSPKNRDLDLDFLGLFWKENQDGSRSLELFWRAKSSSYYQMILEHQLSRAQKAKPASYFLGILGLPICVVRESNNFSNLLASSNLLWYRSLREYQ